MIQLFLMLLRRYFSVEENRFRVRVLHRWDQDEKALQRFWSQVTGIPLTQFYPAQPDRRTRGHPTRRAEYRGVCNVSYCSATLQYTLQAIGESVLNLAAEKGRVVSDDAVPDRVSEPEAPCYRTVYVSPFPEREEIKLVEQTGVEPVASCVPRRRSSN